MKVKEVLVTKKIYIASDGTEFDFKGQCEQYESKNKPLLPEIPYINYYDDLSESSHWYYISNGFEWDQVTKYLEATHNAQLITHDSYSFDDIILPRSPGWFGFEVNHLLGGNRIYVTPFVNIEKQFSQLKEAINKISGEIKDEDS